MKSIACYSVVLFGFFCGQIVSAELLVTPSSTGKNISLQKENFEHIQFKKIKASHYIFQDKKLKIEVDDSASFLMMPFDQVRKISQVSFQWRSIGKPDIESERHEEKRSGDDAVFKVALLLKADDTLFNLMMPAWMKRVDQLLSLPSKEMVYLVAGARHTAGASWVNPYNDRVKMIAMKNNVGANGWWEASYTFEQPVEAVGLWLMSDGDNTGSKFITTVKNIVIEE